MNNSHTAHTVAKLYTDHTKLELIDLAIEHGYRGDYCRATKADLARFVARKTEQDHPMVKAPKRKTMTLIDQVQQVHDLPNHVIKITLELFAK